MISFRDVVDIALAFAAVISGGANPEVVDHTSNLAELSGFNVPTPTLRVILSMANATEPSPPKSPPCAILNLPSDVLIPTAHSVLGLVNATHTRRFTDVVPVYNLNILLPLMLSIVNGVPSPII